VLSEPFEPSIPDGFKFEDPCDEAIVDEVGEKCEDAMDVASACCDTLGSLCDDLLEDCKYDACVEAEGDTGAIDDAVQAIFTDAVDMVCRIPDKEEMFDEENLVAVTMQPTTAKPTTASPTTSEPTTSAPTTSTPTTASPTTAAPTSSPTTPAPTNPGELVCGSSKSGDYNGAPIDFEVQMRFAGDLTVDASGSDFEVSFIICYDSDGNEVTDVDAQASSLTMIDLAANADFACTLDGADGVASGTFSVVISCRSDAPTRSPSAEPTESPTGGEPGDATTPSPVDGYSVGCCYGGYGGAYSYQGSFQVNSQCSKCSTQDQCDSDGCLWMYTNDPSECDVATTESPMTTEDVGCCKGDSSRSNDKCNKKLTSDKCDRSSSCHWISGGVLEDDCAFGTTEAPEEPGCCYINPAMTYSKKYMNTCVGFYTERECVMLSGDDGVARCVWEEKGEDYDCSQLWPTTTSPPPTEPAGCCYADSYKQNDKCSKFPAKDKCEKNRCNWKVTDDPEDCAMTTKTPKDDSSDYDSSDDDTVGCCDSDIDKKFKMCVDKDSAKQCEHASSCFWRHGDDAVCNGPDSSEDSKDEAGCCYGDNKKCVKATDQKKCEKNGCEWKVTEYPEDCELEDSEDSESPEVGCCAGTTPKNNEQCMDFVGREECERAGKKNCEFHADNDCSWLTKKSDYDLPVNPYKRSSKKRRAANHKQEKVLFGAQGVVAETMETTVSLSTLLVMAVAAFAAFHLYKWRSAKKQEGYTELVDVASTV